MYVGKRKIIINIGLPPTILGVINMAHTEIWARSAYVMFTVVRGTG